MSTAGESADRLKVVKMRQSLVEVGEIERLGERQRLDRLTNIIELLDAADPAAGAPGQRATPGFQPHKTPAGEFNLHLKAVAHRHHVHAENLPPMLNNPFG